MNDIIAISDISYVSVTILLLLWLQMLKKATSISGLLDYVYVVIVNRSLLSQKCWKLTEIGSYSKSVWLGVSKRIALICRITYIQNYYISRSSRITVKY
jgi:hypothetical protein